MKVYSTLDAAPTGETETLWVYNGLDVMLTQEIYGVIQPMLEKFGVTQVYYYEKAPLS